jgi:ketosteroid isomerase-like protein
MTNRTAVLRVIDAAYAARIRGENETIAAMCAPDAQFELAGEKSLLEGFPAGPAAFGAAVTQLIDLVQFRSVARVSAVVEGRRAAVHWRATICVAGRPPVETYLFDLWDVTEDGKIAALVQFSDTALIAQELALAHEAVAA